MEEHLAHAQDISLSCRILAEIAGLDEHTCSMYTVAGLIHDMGRLVMASASDRACASLLGTSWYELSHIVTEEREFLGLDHCAVGMEVTQKWNFSPILQEGILRHHSPVREGDCFSTPGAFIFLAHFVSVSDLTGDILARTFPPEVFEKLGLKPDDFNEARKLYDARVPKT